MKALLIFDNVNDLVFSKWDDTFIDNMKKLLDQEHEAPAEDNYTVAQLLSPIITSQRVMAAQFANTYSTMQCKDGTNVAFDEWLDHVFMIVSAEDVNEMQRELLDCKTLVQHICGHNFNLLHAPIYQEWLSMLLECRTKGDSIPGASGIIGESGATAAALNALKSAASLIKTGVHQHYHLMLFVGDKMLALYSSRGSEDITSPDILLLSLQCIAAQEHWESVEMNCIPAEFTDTHPKLNDEHTIRTTRIPWLSEENSAIVKLCAGSGFVPCAPHSMHLVALAQRITLVVLVDMDLREVGISTHLSSQILANIRRLLLQRNLESLPTVLDSLETSVKKTAEALRRNKINTNSNLSARLTSRMLELKKSCTTTTPLTPETTAAAMNTALDAVVEKLRPDIPQLSLCEAVEELQEKLAPYVEFLRVKAMRYFSLGSEPTCSLTRHKYVEEFPGLVHFVFVDRTAGRFLAPDLADCTDMLTKDQVNAMITRGARLVREGYTAATWRSGALHACLVLWWERRGAPVRPRAHHPAAVRALPPPNDILGTFYRQLTEMAFPNESAGVSVKELLCIHLGLLPASTAIQQARRLAHTVHDVAGDTRANPADLL